MATLQIINYTPKSIDEQFGGPCFADTMYAEIDDTAKLAYFERCFRRALATRPWGHEIDAEAQKAITWWLDLFKAGLPADCDFGCIDWEDGGYGFTCLHDMSLVNYGIAVDQTYYGTDDFDEPWFGDPYIYAPAHTEEDEPWFNYPVFDLDLDELIYGDTDHFLAMFEPPDPEELYGNNHLGLPVKINHPRFSDDTRISKMMNRRERRWQKEAFRKQQTKKRRERILAGIAERNQKVSQLAA